MVILLKTFPRFSHQSKCLRFGGHGGFFAGVAKVPIASLVLVAEMTGANSLIVPLLIVSTISYLLLESFSGMKNKFQREWIPSTPRRFRHKYPGTHSCKKCPPDRQESRDGSGRYEVGQNH